MDYGESENSLELSKIIDFSRYEFKVDDKNIKNKFVDKFFNLIYLIIYYL